MKNYFLFQILLLLAIASKAQNQDIIFRQAEQDFVNLYHNIQLKQNENWVEHLTTINSIFFNIDNNYMEKYALLLKSDKGNSLNYNVVSDIADTLNTFFIKNKHYDSTTKAYDSLKELLPQMEVGVCDCISKRIKNKEILNTSEDVSMCYTVYNSNIQLRNQLGYIYASTPYSERWHLEQAVSFYIMTNCTPLRNNTMSMLKATAVEAYSASNEEFFKKLPDKIAQIFITKLYDSLIKIFPNYSIFSKDLFSFSKKEKYSYCNITDIIQANEIKKTYTYVLQQQNKSLIQYQLILMISRTRNGVIVHDFTFLTKDKIKNLKQLQDQFKNAELLPPPFQELKN